MTPQQQSIRTIIKAAGGAAIVLTLAVSCEKKGDPSYDKEVLKLTAENAALAAKFEAAEKKLKEAKPASNDSAPVIAKMEAEIADLKKMLAEKPKAAPAPTGNTPTYNLQAVKLGFMTGVEKLKENLETQNPDYRIDSVTLEKLQLPSSKPFASGVSMKVVSKSTGQTIPFRWNGIGSIDGTWTFQKASNQVVTNTPTNTPGANPPRQAPPINTGGIKVTRISGNGNNGHRTVTPTAQPQPRQPSGQPAPRQPQPTPAPPRRPVRTDGNTHAVDWDNLNK